MYNPDAWFWLKDVDSHTYLTADLPKPTMPDDIPPYTEKELHPDENWDFFNEEKALETYTKWREKNMEHDYIKNDIAKKAKLYSENDPINPDHYKHLPSGLETIDIIKAWTEGLVGEEAVDTGNAIKYISRWKYKNGVEDLRKARWYLSRIINPNNELRDYSLSDIRYEIHLASKIYDDQILFHIELYEDGINCVGEYNHKTYEIPMSYTDTIGMLRHNLDDIAKGMLYHGEGEEDE